MTDTSAWQEFQKSWITRGTVAESEHIGKPAIQATMENDYDRLLAGSNQMSNQDAYASMESAQEKRVITPNPSSTGNIFTNAFNDIRGLATGIFHSPAGLAGAIVGGVLAGTGIGEIGLGLGVIGEALGSAVGGAVGQSAESLGKGGVKAFGENVLAYLPGVQDAEQLFQGNVGYLYQHPIFSLLDLAGTRAMGAQLSDLATTTNEAAQIEAQQASDSIAREEGTMPNPPSAKPIPNLSDRDKALTFQNVMLAKHPLVELAQRAAKGIPTLDSTATDLLTRTGYSNPAKETVVGQHVIEREGNVNFNRVAAQFNVAKQGLSTDDERALYRLLTRPDKSWDEIMADPQVPNRLKDAVVAYKHLTGEYTQIKLDEGKQVRVTRPSTGEEAIVNISGEAAKQMRIYDTYHEKLGEALTKAHRVADSVNTAQDKLLNKPLYDPPLGSSITQMLTGSQYLDSLRNLVNSTPIIGQVARDGAGTQATRNAEARYTALFAPQGPVDQLGKALNTRNFDRIQTAMKNTFGLNVGKSKLLSSAYYRDSEPVRQLQKFVDDIKKSIQVTKSASTPGSTIHGQLAKASKEVARWTKNFDDQAKLVERRWNEMTADKWENVIEGIMAGKLTDLVRQGAEIRKIGDKEYVALPVSEDVLNDVLELVNAGNLFPIGMEQFIDPKVWYKIRTDAIAELDTLKQAGIDPVWVHKVPEGKNLRPVRVGTSHLPSESATFDRAINMSYAIQSPFLALAHAYLEHFDRDSTDSFYEKFIKDHLMPAAQLDKQIQDEYLISLRAGMKGLPDYSEFRAHHLEPGWTKFDFSRFLHPDSRYIPIGDEESTMMIRKSDDFLLRSMDQFRSRSIGRAWDKSLKVFRFSVLHVSPRFIAHISLGGAFMTTLQTGVDAIRFLREAHDMIANDRMYAHGTAEEQAAAEQHIASGQVKAIPVAIPRGTGYESEVTRGIYDKSKFHDWYNTPTQLHHYLGGSTLGKLFIQSFAKRLHLDSAADWASARDQAYMSWLESISDHYRVIAYLYGKDHFEAENKPDFKLTESDLRDAARWGLSPSEYAGVKLARKVLADNDTRTPLEQAAVRLIMPFGGWTKHVLRYVMLLPSDHPIRTNVLASISEQAYDSDNTGLPEYLFHLLYLGEPDANGNVSVVDFRQWNPLRDVANYMTLAGWIQQLNPALQGIASSLGINTSTGTPDLYPNLSYDSFYGGYQAENPQGSFWQNMVGAYVPQYEVLDHFFKLSSYTKSLARYDPSAYQQQLYQSLNFPWVPETINIDQIIGKQETDELNTMGSMVKDALVNNDPSYLSNLSGPWPYDGWYFSTGQIKDLITAANQWSDKAGIQVPAADLVSIPSAPAVPVDISPPATISTPS